MEKIEIYGNHETELKSHLVRIGDVINIEGPVLSLFQDDRSNDLYLFDWVDSDDKTNRWLIYQIFPEVLNDFLLRKISYRKMFESILLRDFYFADIVNSENLDFFIQKIKNLPKKYLSTKDVFLDIDDAKDFDEIFKVVHTIVERNKKSDIQVNKIYIDTNFLLSQAQGRFERLSRETKVIYIDTKNQSTKLEVQNYVSSRNRLPQRKGVGILQS